MAFPSESEDDRIDESPEVEQPDDNDRDVDVSERDGKTEVEVHRESRRERKQREFDERNQKRIEESLGPIRQQNEALQRQLAEFIQLSANSPSSRSSRPASRTMESTPTWLPSRASRQRSSGAPARQRTRTRPTESSWSTASSTRRPSTYAPASWWTRS